VPDASRNSAQAAYYGGLRDTVNNTDVVHTFDKGEIRICAQCYYV
jgi:hypothetical protein